MEAVPKFLLDQIKRYYHESLQYDPVTNLRVLSCDSFFFLNAPAKTEAFAINTLIIIIDLFFYLLVLYLISSPPPPPTHSSFSLLFVSWDQ